MSEALRRKALRRPGRHQQDDLMRLDGLVVDEIEALGQEYRFPRDPAGLSPFEKKDQPEAAVAAELIQILDKLERGVS